MLKHFNKKRVYNYLKCYIICNKIKENALKEYFK